MLSTSVIPDARFGGLATAWGLTAEDWAGGLVLLFNHGRSSQAATPTTSKKATPSSKGRNHEVRDSTLIPTLDSGWVWASAWAVGLVEWARLTARAVLSASRRMTMLSLSPKACSRGEKISSNPATAPWTWMGIAIMERIPRARQLS